VAIFVPINVFMAATNEFGQAMLPVLYGELLCADMSAGSLEECAESVCKAVSKGSSFPNSLFADYTYTCNCGGAIYRCATDQGSDYSFAVAMGALFVVDMILLPIILIMIVVGLKTGRTKD